MKATTAIIICLFGLTVALVAAANSPPRPNLYNQFTCTKCNYTFQSSWYGTLNSIGQYWENGPTAQSRRSYPYGPDNTPTTEIKSMVNSTNMFQCDMSGNKCGCTPPYTPDIFYGLNAGYGYFDRYETVRGIKCELWWMHDDSFSLQLWVTPRDANGYNTAIRYKESSGATIDFLEMTYGAPDPSLFEKPAECKKKHHSN